MELGRFFIDIQDDNILYVLSRITNDEIKRIRQVCERYDYEEEDVRYYDVYEVECTSGKKVLKKTGTRELFNYETYLSGNDYAVPFYYGKYIEEDSVWILIENISGDDLRDFCADGLTYVETFQVNGECDAASAADLQNLEALPVVCPENHVLVVTDFKSHTAADAQPFSRNNDCVRT